VQVGADLLGDADGWGDQSGASVSLSSDGSRIAIGALFNDGETSGVQNSNHGHVRVFEYDESSSSWMKVGGTCDQDFRCTGDIDGEAAWDESGTAVSLSGDGSRVAIGAPENDGAGLSAGHVRVFEYDGSTWTQIGLDIDGGGPDNRAGRFVSLSADGSRVAIGANDYGGTDMSGHVRVYEYDGSSWVLMGSGIDGVKAGDYSCVVSLSSDGSRVAIGALYRDTRPEVPGPVRVFEYDGSDWVQLGFGLYGDANDIEAYDKLAVSLSGDGSRLAVGASPTTIGALTDAGRVRVFELFRPAEQPGWIFELVPTYSGIGQFSGAATAGDGRVVFAPANADHVGVYDPTDDSFTMVPVGVTGDPLIGMNGKFNGAADGGRRQGGVRPFERRTAWGCSIRRTTVSRWCPSASLETINLTAPLWRVTAGWCSPLKTPPAWACSIRRPTATVFRWWPSSPVTKPQHGLTGNLPAPRRRATAGWCSHLRSPPALVFSTRQPRLEVSLRWCPSSPRTTTSTQWNGSLMAPRRRATAGWCSLL
jgi:hypothetical protein